MLAKKVMAGCLLLASLTSRAETLIAWDGGTGTNTAIRADGINGTLFTGKLYAVDAAAGSTDGTFGAAIPGASTTPPAYSVRTASPGSKNTVGFQIVNNTGGELQLQTVSFDYLAWFANSPKTVTLTYANGNLADADNTVLQSISGLGDGGGKISDYPDYDWTLENLFDYVLADGESATFELSATDAGNENTSGGFDNIAISGVRGNQPPSVSVAIDTEQSTVSKMAMGAGLVYAWAPDALYADGEIAHIVKDIGIGTLRWPGGTVVTHYHWNDLNGLGWTDSWNPAYDPANNQPPENFMDLDEYLALIDQTGAEIMLGVNMSSGKEWNREADGIDEARALMQACKDRGYDVKYIYFDNENYHEGNGYNKDVDGDGESWNPTNYAESFNLYAAAVKQVFPSAKLIANWRNNVTTTTFRNQVEEMFSIAGANIDYLDIHWYWQWDTATWPLWKTQLPMQMSSGSSSSNSSYADAIAYANNLFATLGYPHIRVAVMEWNIAPGPWQTDPEHNHFKTALMQTEMQMQFLRAGLDIGLIYALHGTNADPTAADKHVMAFNDPNATALWMWLFSKTAGKTVVQSSSPAPGIYSVAAKGSQGELVVYLLNKTDSDQTIEFNIPGYAVDEISEAWRFHDGGFGKGALQKISLWEVMGRKRTTLQANSLNMVGFNYPAISASPDTDADGDGMSDYDEAIAGTDPNDPQSLLSFRHERYIPPEPFGNTVLAGWHTTSGAADAGVPGISGFLSAAKMFGIDATAGSTDGTFGATNAGASTALSAYAVRTVNLGSNNTLGFGITNGTGLDLHLDAVHFDYSRWNSGSPQDVALLYVSGDLDVASNTVVASATGIPVTAKAGNYSDFDWPLAGLGDTVLRNGESASFTLVASNASGEYNSGAFDNIAISGSGVSAGAGPSVNFTWRGQTGKQYRMLQTTNLLSESWAFASPTVQGVPGDNAASVAFEGAPLFFYRLQVSP